MISFTAVRLFFTWGANPGLFNVLEILQMVKIIAGSISSCKGKKDSTSTLLRQNPSYCDMPGKKRLNFHTFTTKSVLLRHAKRKKPQPPRFCSNIDTKAWQSTQKTQRPPYCDNLSRKSAKIPEKDSFFVLLRH